jgi:hypothetical protein
MSRQLRGPHSGVAPLHPRLEQGFPPDAPARGCAPVGQRGRSPPRRAIAAGGCDPAVAFGRQVAGRPRSPVHRVRLPPQPRPAQPGTAIGPAITGSGRSRPGAAVVGHRGAPRPHSDRRRGRRWSARRAAAPAVRRSGSRVVAGRLPTDPSDERCRSAPAHPGWRGQETDPPNRVTRVSARLGSARCRAAATCGRREPISGRRSGRGPRNGRQGRWEPSWARNQPGLSGRSRCRWSRRR